MLGWFSAAVLAATPAPRCVQIIGTNDVHGHLEAEAHPTKADKTLAVNEGGLAIFGGYLDVLRAKYPRQTLLLDAGDLFQGTVPSNLSKGAAVIAAFNALGYQGAALGNHEFDFGPVDGDADLLGAIKQRMVEAHFPFLACNIVDAQSGKLPAWKNFAASTLLTINKIKVGVIGAITPDTPTVTVPLNVASLKFLDPAPEVIAEAARLRKAGAQVLVLVAHIGGECRNLKDPTDESSCDGKSEIATLLEKLPEGTIDVALAGHTHKFIANKIRGVAVSEAGSYSHAFGWIEACVDGQGKVATTIHPPTSLCAQAWKEGGCGAREAATGEVPAQFLGRRVKPDPRVLKAIAPYLARVKAQQEARIGVTLKAPVTRSHDAPSPLGTMVAEAVKQAMPGADVGLTNAGGIRANLPAGELTFGQVFEVLPFDNRVVALHLTGAELKEFVIAPLRGGHGFPQLAGLTLTFDAAHPEATVLTLASGKPVDPAAAYVLATNDFLANGGDATHDIMAKLKDGGRRETGPLVRDAFLTWLKAQKQPLAIPAP
jgi:5'-nucleotidase